MVNKIPAIIRALNESEEFSVELYRDEFDSITALPEIFKGGALCLTLGNSPKILLDLNALTFVGGKKASLSSWGVIDENFTRSKMFKKDVFILNVPKIDIKLPKKVGIEVWFSNGKSFRFKPSKDAPMVALEGELNNAIDNQLRT